MGLGHLGVPWGWVSWGVRRWGCDLGLDGVLVTLDAVSLARHAALLGMPVPADVGCQPGGRTVPELVRGGFGDLGALCLRVGVTAGLGGLGPGWCAAGSMGWCMRLGPALVWGSSMHRCLRRGGPIEAGVNGLYLGVLLSYVVWELTGWWGGVVFPLLWGLMGRPGLPWALVRMGLAPRPGQIWGNGGAYGGQRGSWLQRGGYFAPSDAFLPIPKASLLPLHHTNT